MKIWELDGLLIFLSYLMDRVLDKIEPHLTVDYISVFLCVWGGRGGDENKIFLRLFHLFKTKKTKIINSDYVLTDYDII